MRKPKLIIAAMFLLSPFMAHAGLIEINGAGELDGRWEITLHEVSFASFVDELRLQVWWGDTIVDYDAAIIFATALGPVPGVNNFELGVGPLFAYLDAGIEFYSAAWSDGTAFGLGANPFVAGGRFYTDRLVFATATRVPEPATLALFAIGLAGMGFARRRNRTV